MAAGENGLITIFRGTYWERARMGRPILASRHPNMNVTANKKPTKQTAKKAANSERKVPLSKVKGFVYSESLDSSGSSELESNMNDILFTVQGTSDNDVITAGRNGVAYHFDGKRWKKMDTGDKTGFYRLAAFAPDNYYASCRNGVIKKYNGKNWRTDYIYELPNGSRPSLFGIWGSSPDNIYAVGEQHTLLHFDGKGWQKLEVPESKNPKAYFYSVWGLSDKDIYILGDEGLLYHFDGHIFTKMNIPTSYWLMSIWGTDPNNLYVVGEDGTFLHYNGKNWLNVSKERTCLFDITGDSKGNFYTAGFGSTYTKFHSNEVYEEIEMDNCRYITDIWISPGNKIFMVGETKTPAEIGR
jgi:hypothetical protein